MKTLLSRARFRLLLNVLALAVVLGALHVSPRSASAKIFDTFGGMCDSGCVNWTQNGCVQMQFCCVYDWGQFSCVYY
jgi:hypothetical protein